VEILSEPKRPLVAFRREFALDCFERCKFVDECPLVPPGRRLTPQQLTDWLEKRCPQADRIIVKR